MEQCIRSGPRLDDDAAGRVDEGEGPYIRRYPRCSRNMRTSHWYFVGFPPSISDTASRQSGHFQSSCLFPLNSSAVQCPSWLMPSRLRTIPIVMKRSFRSSTRLRLSRTIRPAGIYPPTSVRSSVHLRPAVRPGFTWCRRICSSRIAPDRPSEEASAPPDSCHPQHIPEFGEFARDVDPETADAVQRASSAGGGPPVPRIRHGGGTCEDRRPPVQPRTDLPKKTGRPRVRRITRATSAMTGSPERTHTRRQQDPSPFAEMPRPRLHQNFFPAL